MFLAASFIAALSLFFTVVGLYTGFVPGRNAPISQADDPVRFNFEIGALMIIAVGSVVYWYVLWLRMLRDRRDRRVLPEQEK